MKHSGEKNFRAIFITNPCKWLYLLFQKLIITDSKSVVSFHENVSKLGQLSNRSLSLPLRFVFLISASTSALNTLRVENQTTWSMFIITKHWNDHIIDTIYLRNISVIYGLKNILIVAVLNLFLDIGDYATLSCAKYLRFESRS